MDESAVVELVGKVYEAAYERSKWREHLQLLKQQTGAMSACLIGHDPVANDGFAVELAGSPEVQREPAGHDWRTEEHVRNHRRAGIGRERVWSSHQVAPGARTEAGEAYDELMRPRDMFHFAGGAVLETGPMLVWCGVRHSRRQGPADARSLRLLAALMPHQKRALLIDCRLRQLDAARRIAGGAFEGLPYGLVALDRYGRVLAMNKVAEEIVIEGDGLCLGPGGLAALRPREDQALQQAIAVALAAAPTGSSVQLPRPSGPQPLRLIVAPVPREERPAALDDLTPAALVFVHDPSRRAPAPVETLRRLYRLTPQQARLTALLVDGASLAEAAEALGVARRTAASHLEQVFRKTGARRQVELIRLLSSLPAIAGLDGDDG